MRYIYVCGLLAAAAAAQAGEYRPPRLADGQVDLQGVWSHKNITPLERPAELKSFVITREEAAQLQARILAKSEDLSKPGRALGLFLGARRRADPRRVSQLHHHRSGRRQDSGERSFQVAGEGDRRSGADGIRRSGSTAGFGALSRRHQRGAAGHSRAGCRPAADRADAERDRHRVRGAARSTRHSHECAAHARCRRLVAGRFDRLVGRRDARDRDQVLRADQRCARRSRRACSSSGPTRR